MLIIHAIIPVTTGTEPITDGALLIRDGRIRQIGKTTDLSTLYPLEERLDAQGQVLIPGFINAHTRMSRILTRGYPLPALDRVSAGGETLEFWRKYARVLDYEAVRYSALLAALEAVRYGTTLVFDLLSAPEAIQYALDAVAEAVLMVGLRANLAYAVSDHEGLPAGRLAVYENQRFAARAKEEALLSGAMGLDTCHFISDTTLANAVGAAAIAQVGFHGVVGESLYAGRDCALAYGVSPTTRFRRWGVLSKRTLLADALYLSPQDRELVRQNGTWLVHNVRANIVAGVGLARVLDYAAEGLTICLGTDGLDYDMPGECQAAWLAQMQSAVLDREGSLDQFTGMLLESNAHMASVMLGDKVGVLETGALADLVLVDSYNTVPVYLRELRRLLLVNSGGLRIDTVIVGGQVLYRHGAFQTVDTEHIVVQARQITKAIWHKLG